MACTCEIVGVPFRAESVGSLLSLLARHNGRSNHSTSKLRRDGLHEAEDAEIRTAVAKREVPGLQQRPKLGDAIAHHLSPNVGGVVKRG